MTTHMTEPPPGAPAGVLDTALEPVAAAVEGTGARRAVLAGLGVALGVVVAAVVLGAVSGWTLTTLVRASATGTCVGLMAGTALWEVRRRTPRVGIALGVCVAMGVQVAAVLGGYLVRDDGPQTLTQQFAYLVAGGVSGALLVAAAVASSRRSMPR